MRLSVTTALLVLLLGCNSRNEADGSPPPPAPPADADLLKQIKLPDGFTIDWYAADVPGARSLTLAPDGTVIVGTRGAGKVYALLDSDGDNKAEKVLTLASGLNSPNGVAVRGSDLYVAEIGQILRYNDMLKRLQDPPKPVAVTASYPDDTHHGWKFIAFGPDGFLYVPVGAPCDICLSEKEIYASITRLNVDNGDIEVYAHGIRNTVGFDWHPETKVLWFTDNGRDWMGDDKPPDELNRVAEKGMHFGFPFCHGKDLPDPKFGQGKECSDYVPPVLELGAHVAALGMRFYTGKMFPSSYRNQIFIAEHGSWNRSTPIGYRVMLARLDGPSVTALEEFATGWLQDGEDWGRPVDVLVMPDGALLVSDDKKGAVYRISYP